MLPGRLSVSRTFGDVEAKDPRLGGLNGVIIAVPDITQFKVNTLSHEFIVMGCDGIFDKLSNREVVDLAWKQTLSNSQRKHGVDIHTSCAETVDLILTESVKRKTLDNITVVIIAFSGLKKAMD